MRVRYFSEKSLLTPNSACVMGQATQCTRQLRQGWPNLYFPGDPGRLEDGNKRRQKLPDSDPEQQCQASRDGHPDASQLAYIDFESRTMQIPAYFLAHVLEYHRLAGIQHQEYSRHKPKAAGSVARLVVQLALRLRRSPLPAHRSQRMLSS